MKKLIFISIFFLGIISNLYARDEKGRLTIKVSNVQVAAGAIHVALYNQADVFLTEKTFMTSIEKVKDGKEMLIVLEDVPYGEYAISLYHDENSNDELDKYFGMIPKEAYGFSNNAKGNMGPPDYEQSRFTFNTREMEIAIRIDK